MPHAKPPLRFRFYSVTLSCWMLLAAGWACTPKNNPPSQEAIKALSLKAGSIITCGPSSQQFGTLRFPVSEDEKINEDFALGLKLLHSFEYDEAEKAFARIIERQPDCAMAYWGVAMSSFHPLWTPPSETELAKGARAVALGQSIASKSEKEGDYLQAVGVFYKDWQTANHSTRCQGFEEAMHRLHRKYPLDKEAAILYALALNAAAAPTDSTFAKQKKAGAILSRLYPDAPNHPGIIHYLIHTYDSPRLAPLGLSAARQYASVAPSSAHALHMPSHIFTRLGLWNECIQSNLASVESARCYAESAGMKGHWDEEIHGLDYLTYAYLQQGNNAQAARQLAYLRAMTEVEPVNFKVAYAFAAVPARYYLENKRWKEAAALESRLPGLAWEKHPWQAAITHYARALGSVQSGDSAAARRELAKLKQLHQQLLKQQDAYKAQQVEIQANTAEAWLHLSAGDRASALAFMTKAADQEDRTEKHPVTPGEVLPARELLADMLLQLKNPAAALLTYQAVLRNRPGRFNALYGAGLAAQTLGKADKAAFYYQKLLDSCKPVRSDRPEWAHASRFVAQHQPQPL